MITHKFGNVMVVPVCSDRIKSSIASCLVEKCINWWSPRDSQKSKAAIPAVDVCVKLSQETS